MTNKPSENTTKQNVSLKTRTLSGVTTWSNSHPAIREVITFAGVVVVAFAIATVVQGTGLSGTHSINEELSQAIEDQKSESAAGQESISTIGEGTTENSSESEESAETTEAVIADTESNSSMSISIDSTTSTSSAGLSSSNDGDVEPTVTLNGEPIELSRTGRYSEDYETENTETDTDLDIDVEGTGTTTINITTNDGSNNGEAN